MLGALSLLLNGGGVEQLQNIAQELNAALDGQRAGDPRDAGQRRHAGVHPGREQGRHHPARSTASTGSPARSTREQDQLAVALDSLGPGLKVLNDQRDAARDACCSALDSLSGVAVDTVEREPGRPRRRPARRSRRAAEARRGGRGPAEVAASCWSPIPFTDEAVNGVKGDYFNLYAKIDLDLQAHLDNLSRSRRNPLQDIPILGDVTGGQDGAGGAAAAAADPRRSRPPGSRRGGGLGGPARRHCWEVVADAARRRVRLQLVAFVVIAVVGDRVRGVPVHRPRHGCSAPTATR